MSILCLRVDVVGGFPLGLTQPKIAVYARGFLSKRVLCVMICSSLRYSLGLKTKGRAEHERVKRSKEEKDG